jgi:hypothetical protein
LLQAEAYRLAQSQLSSQPLQLSEEALIEPEREMSKKGSASIRRPDSFKTATESLGGEETIAEDEVAEGDDDRNCTVM